MFRIRSCTSHWPLTLVLLLLALSFRSNAQLPITLNDPSQSHNLQGRVEVLVDTSKELSMDDILKPSVKENFSVDKKSLSYGFTDDAYWFRFRLRNEESALKGSWALEIPYPVLDKVEVYQLTEDGIWHVSELGDTYPFYKREFIYRHFIVPLNFIDRSVHTFYVKIETGSSMRVPMRIRSVAELQESNLETEIIYGIYYGVMLVMLIYNLLVFFTLNDTSYLYYVLSIFFTITLFSSLSGHAFQYLWYDSIWWANQIIPISMGGLAIGSALFARSFLEVKKYSRPLYHLLNVIIGSGIAIIIATIALGYIVTVMGVFLLAVDTFVLLTTGIICWKRGNRAARYYVFAWVFYLLGALLIILVSYGLLPSHPILLHAVEVGSAIEVTLLAIALSDRYSIIRKDRERLQVEALEGQRKMTMVLEERVAERTIEINRKKEEIERKNQRLEQQNQEIAHQKDNIEGSIRYARRIQAAMLPSEREFREALPEAFVFYKPRDIVSGDFYWLTQKEGKLIVAVSDCTGHGVPGAFMSMLGTSLLSEIINLRGIEDPAIILEELNKGVKQSLNQDYTQNHDGMEISICVFDKRRYEIEFAGANTSLIYIQDDELEVVKGDRLPIGGHRDRYEGREFRTKRLPWEAGMAIYMYSDGFRDQFGGAKGEKFMMRRFKSLLKDISQEPMEAQEIIIRRTFKDWLGSRRQLDDVLIMGIRLE